MWEILVSIVSAAYRMEKSFNLSDLKLKDFAREVQALGIEAKENLNHSDFHHLRRVEFWGKASTIVGFSLSWLQVNPVSIFLIAIGLSYSLAAHASYKSWRIR